MKVYRLTRLKYAQDLTGYGASLRSNSRWNSKGNSILYTATSKALAFAEVIPHLSLRLIPMDYVMVSLLLPTVTRIVDAKLSTSIRNSRLQETQRLGDEFLMSKFHFAMQVPSYVIPDENNLLINPSHPEMKNVLINDVQPFQFDDRFFTAL
ncbi:MAG: RES family NAD+ phosphorylase [Nonlabens sp.]